jgi:hypothetical protein
MGPLVFLLACLSSCGAAQSAGNASLVYAGNASLVYGQLGSFFTLGSSTSATGLNVPKCVRVDVSGALYVCDTNNRRVVKYAAGQPNTAVAVWGQPDFTTSAQVSPPTASSISLPQDLAFYGGGMYVVDSGYHRVVLYAPGQLVATQVWGQVDFVSSGMILNLSEPKTHIHDRFRDERNAI